jgi:hypothetical protein
MWRNSRRACCKRNAETRHFDFVSRRSCLVLEFAQVEGVLGEWLRVRVGFTGEAGPLDVRLSGLLAMVSALIGLSMVAVDFTRWVKARKS